MFTQMCPCVRPKAYRICCYRFHQGKQSPETAEELMRARYCAYVKRKVDYLAKTQVLELDKSETRAFARRVKWLRLEVVNVSGGQPEELSGTVEFKAYYQEDGVEHCLHEISYFERENRQWLFIRAE